MDEEPDVAARRGERDALVGRIGSALGADGRVVAAWLGGSLGRGAADAWSDIDVWAVIEDEAMARFGAEREAVVGAVGAPLLTLEAPKNAPPGADTCSRSTPAGRGRTRSIGRGSRAQRLACLGDRGCCSTGSGSRWWKRRTMRPSPPRRGRGR